MPSFTVDNLWKDNIIADHWRALNLPRVIRNFSLAEQISHIKNLTLTGNPNQKYYCNSPGCVDGIYYGPKCGGPTNMYACATLLSSYPGKYWDVTHKRVCNKLELEVLCISVPEVDCLNLSIFEIYYTRVLVINPRSCQ